MTGLIRRETSTTEDPQARVYSRLLGVVAGSTFVAMLAYSAPLGNAVTLTESFHASSIGTIWTLASMSSGLAVALLAVGLLADQIGRREVFRAGAAAFGLANVVCLAAPEVWTFVAARVLAGIGAAGMIATGLGLVDSAANTDRHRALAARWWSVAMGAGIAVGPVTAGALDLVDRWRLLYLVLALSAMVLWVAASSRFSGPTQRREHARHDRFDFLGVVLLLALLAAMLSAIVEARAHRPGIVGFLGVATIVLTAGFWASQRFRSRRLIDLSLFARRRFLAATIAGLATGIGVIAVMSAACTYFVSALGMTTLQAGGVLAAWSATSALAAVAVGRLAPRLPGHIALVAGLSGTAGALLLLLGIGPESSLLRLLVALGLTGVATGVLNTGLARESVAAVPRQNAATSTATNNTARYLGSSVGVATASIVIAHGNPHTGWDLVITAAVALSGLAAFTVLALVRAPDTSRVR